MLKTCAATLILMATITAMAPTAFAQGNKGPSRILDPVGWARANDASNDRGILTQHADTLPEGDFSINSYELFFLGVSYGVTDDFQVSATTLLPIIAGLPTVLLLNGKYVLERNKHQVVSMGGNVAIFNESDQFTAFGISFNIDQYLGSEGVLGLHGSVDLQGFIGDGEFQEGTIARITGGLNLHAGNRTRLLLELTSPVLFSPNSDPQVESPGMLVNYGVRFHNADLAVDLAFARPVSFEGDVESPFFLGLPFVAFSAKF